MTSALHMIALSDRQQALVRAAYPHPAIVAGSVARTATMLARKGWGANEPGASGERIFRLSQAGADAVERAGPGQGD